MPDQPDDKAEVTTAAQDERDRRAANVFLLVAAIAFIGVGLWIGEGLLRAKRADDCMASGRRNCNPIEVPPDNGPPRRVVDPRP